MKIVKGFAELYWTCPFKTCQTENCMILNQKKPTDVHECCHCKRKTKVQY